MEPSWDNREEAGTAPRPSRRHLALRIAAGAILVVAGTFFAWLSLSKEKSPPENVQTATVPSTEPVSAKHVPLPKEVRGIYVTASTASSLVRLEALADQVAKKGINAIVLDVKTDRGSLAFNPQTASLVSEAPIKPIIKDLDAAVSAIHGRGMYLIARIPVFEDPDYAAKHPSVALHRADGRLWQNSRGLYWLDPAAESVWKYNADIAKEVHARGFDEVQFDYIRFATDGKTSQIVYPAYDPKRENYRGTMGRLFAYLDTALRNAGIPTSIDVFGLTAWHQSDLGIGQWYPDALAHFDYVSAMVYPSHYFSGTLGYKNPAAYPYEIVLDSLKKGNESVSALAALNPPVKSGAQRPWLQAFDMGAKYTPEMVMKQVRAARETGCPGFLFWNAGNKYSALPNLAE